jgi:hypothetical protein
MDRWRLRWWWHRETGLSDFVPDVPAEAKRLIVRWDEMELTSRCLLTRTGLAGAPIVGGASLSEPKAGTAAAAHNRVNLDARTARETWAPTSLTST